MAANLRKARGTERLCLANSRTFQLALQRRDQALGDQRESPPPSQVKRLFLSSKYCLVRANAWQMLGDSQIEAAGRHQLPETALGSAACAKLAHVSHIHGLVSIVFSCAATPTSGPPLSKNCDAGMSECWFWQECRVLLTVVPGVVGFLLLLFPHECLDVCLNVFAPGLRLR